MLRRTFPKSSTLPPRWCKPAPASLPRSAEAALPEECLEQPSIAAMSGATLAQRMTYRWPRLPGWMTGSAGGAHRAEFWMCFRDRRTAGALSLPTLVDAAAPVVLDLGELDSSTIELSGHVRAVPTSVWLACRARTRDVMLGLHEEDFEIRDTHGVPVAQSRQLAVLSSGRFGVQRATMVLKPVGRARVSAPTLRSPDTTR
ncbi:MAG: hypothetical protein EOO22_01780 [Comamonadaceae bacterium]|nr:MAG: hypothetical protein EOO22_01780 [Comamonadaceae bacterium]